MGEQGSDDTIKFKLFLEEFTAKHNGPLTADDPLPFRLVTYRMTPEEVEGECIEWVMEYLFGLNHCPPSYAAVIAKATVEAIKSSDLSAYEVEREEEEGKLIGANGFARFVFSTVHRICEEWNASLPNVRLGPCLHKISMQAIRNTRRKMEDKHVVIQDLSTIFNSRLKDPDDTPRAFYAVYDGHGGVDASYYAAAHLHLHTVAQPDFVASPTSALKKAFNETDIAFIEKAGREGLRSGSTGVAVVVDPDTIHLAWLGDSQAVLMRNRQPIVVMEPHKPDREDEKKRIEDLGGCVVWFGGWRVNGSLAVSRSIGDPDYKPYVSSDADTAVIPLDGTEECIIIACDGLWDTVTPEEACQAIDNYIETGTDLGGMASKLVTMAKDQGSHDNITVLVVFLNPFRQKTVTSDASEREEVAVSEQTGKESEGDDSSKLSKDESQKESAEETQEVAKDTETSAGDSNLTLNDASVTDVEANVNNNNINRNSVNKHIKSKINSAKQANGLLIKNGPNVLSGSTANRKKKSNSAQQPLAVLSDSKRRNSPDSAPNSPNTKSFPISRRNSNVKKTVNPVRRSSSTPPAQQRKLPSGDIIEDINIAELGIHGKKTKSASVKAPPAQHRSMPITIKPKSLKRTRSLPRDPKLAAIIKNKTSADVQR